jgi:cytochrome c peroxidase
MRVFQRCVRPKSKRYLMRIASLAFTLCCSCALLPATAASEDTGVGSPLALAPGEAPPLIKQGPLADPRSFDQVGLPKILN